jgi:methionyl-tRNA formyltransferase
MKRVKAVLLMTPSTAKVARLFAESAGIDLDAAVVGDLRALESACNGSTQLLLAFGTGVIVPAHVLALPGLLALNIHGASPDFPGRDPHHFAQYQGVRRYGATLHFMHEAVDAGPIVDLELFDVEQGATPAMLLAGANQEGTVLMQRFFAAYARDVVPRADPSLRWGPRKSRRQDFLELCRVHPDMDEREFLRRLEATSMPGYNNLYMDLHGFRFRLEDRAE